jgi:hypothetical protein
MSAVTSKRQRIWNRVLVALIFLLVIIYLLPLYWISSTAFKPRSLATTVPPTVVFQPEVTPFVKLFTARVQMRGEVEPEIYEKAPWYEKRVFDSGERIIKDAFNIDDAHRFAIFFAKKLFDVRPLLRLFIRELISVHWIITADHRIHKIFDLADLFYRERFVMAKIKTEVFIVY